MVCLFGGSGPRYSRGIKIVADRSTGRVLGVLAVAANTGEMILAAVNAVNFGLTVTDLADTWAP